MCACCCSPVGDILSEVEVEVEVLANDNINNLDVVFCEDSNI